MDSNESARIPRRSRVGSVLDAFFGNTGRGGQADRFRSKLLDEVFIGSLSEVYGLIFVSFVRNFMLNRERVGRWDIQCPTKSITVRVCFR